MINHHLNAECINSEDNSDIECPDYLMDERADRANSHYDTEKKTVSQISVIKPTTFKTITSTKSSGSNCVNAKPKSLRRLSTPSPKLKSQEKRQPKITGEF